MRIILNEDIIREFLFGFRFCIKWRNINSFVFNFVYEKVRCYVFFCFLGNVSKEFDRVL